MCDLIPIIEGPVKFRDGKKWKNRYACVTRLSPVADSLTLQLWKDRKDCERNPPSKGSLALQEYLGWEAGFTLDKESQTLALILKDDVIIFALDNRETLMRWQVRVTGQFEEGQHFNSHLIQLPSKSKLPLGGVKIHIQNRRFSMTHGVPPRLVHSWNLADLRRYGGLENGRFCFEGGSRCGKGEGVHLLRLDDPEELQHAFDAATKGKLESKRKSVYKTMGKSPSLSSHIDGCGMSAAQSVISVATTANGRHFDVFDSRLNNTDVSSTDSMSALIHANSLRGSRDDLLRTRSSSRSRSGNTWMNWSVNEGSSCDTMSIALSELTEASCMSANQMASFQNQMTNLVNSSNDGQSQQHSPEHLVNRKDLLERMGISTKHSRGQPGSRSMGNSGDFAPQWSMDLTSCSTSRGSFKGQSSRSIDRISISSHDSQASSGGAGSEASSARSNYDTPKTVTAGSQNISPFGQQQRRSWSVQSGGGSSQHRSSQSVTSPPMTPKSQRHRQSRQVNNDGYNPLKSLHVDTSDYAQMNYATIPCNCDSAGLPSLAPKADHSSSAANNASVNPNAYENYDIPRSLCKLEAMQYYDTPRSVKEALELTEASSGKEAVNPYGNYDVPHPGSQPIPVFKKPCGCIMKLVPTLKQKAGECPSWTCIGNDSSEVHSPRVMATGNGNDSSEIQIPRVKLTGTGKMPVADMRAVNNALPFQCPILQDQDGYARLVPQQQQLQQHLQQQMQPVVCLDPNVRGLPPKSPVYAVVNKINKKKVQTPQQQQSPQHSLQQQQTPAEGLQYHNYCNVAPLLGDVVKQSGKEYQQTCMINGQNSQQQQPQPQNLPTNMFIGQNSQQQQHQQQFIYKQQQLNNQLQKQQQQQQQHQQYQYQKIEHDLSENNGGGHYYENSTAVLARLNNNSALANQNATANNQESASEYHQQPGSVKSQNGSSINHQNSSATSQNGSASNHQNFSNSASGMGDYIPMDPKMFQTAPPTTEMPLIPFEPLTYTMKDGAVQGPPKYESIDPISQKLKEFQDALDTDETTYASLVNNAYFPAQEHLSNGTQASCLFNLCDLTQNLQLDGEVDFQSLLDQSSDYSNKSSSMELLTTTGWLNNLPVEYQAAPKPPGTLTIPRSHSKSHHSESSHTIGYPSSQQAQPVTMRRSSSVPCKPLTDRGSTSSSDSGFSPGSPSQNVSSSHSHLIGGKT